LLEVATAFAREKIWPGSCIAPGKKDGDREAEPAETIEKIRRETWKTAA
jgi:hypothetical protein